MAKISILVIITSGHTARVLQIAFIVGAYVLFSVTSNKSPNVNKSHRNMISLKKLKIFTPLQKLPKYVGDLGKLIVATGFEKLPKVQ